MLSRLSGLKLMFCRPGTGMSTHSLRTCVAAGVTTRMGSQASPAPGGCCSSMSMEGLGPSGTCSKKYAHDLGGMSRGMWAPWEVAAAAALMLRTGEAHAKPPQPGLHRQELFSQDCWAGMHLPVSELSALPSCGRTLPHGIGVDPPAHRKSPLLPPSLSSARLLPWGAEEGPCREAPAFSVPLLLGPNSLPFLSEEGDAVTRRPLSLRS
mmetsp:Transcript_7855/g.19230  ORF Transcript_7855/g.19230 Transcript_7855/m.19230 type:complete len:209 (+) Transcript_7855:1449-2075(+)